MTVQELRKLIDENYSPYCDCHRNGEALFLLTLFKNNESKDDIHLSWSGSKEDLLNAFSVTLEQDLETLKMLEEAIKIVKSRNNDFINKSLNQ